MKPTDATSSVAHESAKASACVRVALNSRSYSVLIGTHILPNLASLFMQNTPKPLPKQVFAVLDTNASSHAQRIIKNLKHAHTSVQSVSIHAAETKKTLDTLRTILVAMADAKLERSDLVLAIGGGITGDLAGFAAATYRRGIRVVQCPTTLLSMVDASVGGKTGVNLDVAGVLEKNMVGAFHQPELVVADIATLSTLPEREFNAGLAECIKHGLLGNMSSHATHQTHLAWIKSSLKTIMARQPDTLLELLERSVSFKAWIVAGDEQELASSTPGQPSRALLNLGHTFAHAIETIHTLSPDGNPAHGPLLHGEAVGLGLVASAATSVQLGLCSESLVEEIRAMLDRCHLPSSIANLPAHEHLLSRMGSDKKVAQGRLRLILPVENSRARIIDAPPHKAIQAGWDSIRA